MTSIPESDWKQPGPSALQAIPQEHRPILRPRLVLAGAAFLAMAGLLYGIHTRHVRREATASTAAFRPYEVIIRGNPQGSTAPMATQSATDLQQWDATRPTKNVSDDASVGDNPAHVRLYFSKRIVLIPPGTTGRVLLEQGGLRRIRILDGLYSGATGFISRTALEPAGESPPRP